MAIHRLLKLNLSTREFWRLPIDPVPGDSNGDGKVDFIDYLNIANNFGKDNDVSYFDGDFDIDGDVDFQDFLVIANNFG